MAAASVSPSATNIGLIVDFAAAAVAPVVLIVSIAFTGCVPAIEAD